MSEMLDRAREMKPELDRAEAARQEAIRIKNAELEARLNTSNEHAAEFTKLMEDNNVPTIDLYVKSSNNKSLDNASLLGKGWIIYPPVATTVPGENDTSGLVILQDLSVFYYLEFIDNKIFITSSDHNLQKLALFADQRGLNTLIAAVAESGIV
ncbi:MAG: hypothetical protein WCJ36_03160 [Candidatus Saccharibacteria bacterium]